MPIFQESDQGLPTAAEVSKHSQLNHARSSNSNKTSETDFFQPKSRAGPQQGASPRDTGKNQKSECIWRDGPIHSQGGVCTSDRRELMERIKRGESPTWVPPSQTLQEEYSKNNHELPLLSLAKPAPHEPSPLLPPAELQQKRDYVESGRYADELSPPSEIVRPRSALHAGDFTRDSQHASTLSQQALRHDRSTSSFHALETSQIRPWDIPSQRSEVSPITSPNPERAVSREPKAAPSRSRAPSLNSYSSSYVAKAPTTPLVQHTNSTDLEFSPIDLSSSPSKASRRHTLPPRPPLACSPSSDGQSSRHASAAHQPPSLPRDGTFPFQTHRARRSLTTAWSLQASPSPQKPSFLSSRRQSFSSDASPLQHASMVGSYEESILRGWMSTAPSKPVDFTAQIGVMGKGSCKPKCPAHITVPFPAVFYSWNGAPGRKHSAADDEPSPYVGHVDLQQLPTATRSKKIRVSRSKSPRAETERTSRTQISLDTGDVASLESISKQKKRRRTSPAPPDPCGAYRIPQQGQLQICIKNPNKTAVKLFLVPYDLEDMEAGSKTFIRQRCYSGDTVIDGLPRISVKSKPTLRYLIHVNLCCPSPGRYFLYQHIRVVFASRVPDKEEQLQTETQLPQPKYSAYHASTPLSRSVSGSKEKANRRRSLGARVGHEGMDDRHPGSFRSSSVGSDQTYPFLFSTPPPPVPGIPIHLSNPQSRQIDVTYNMHNSQGNPSGESFPFLAHGGLPASPTPAYPFRLPKRQYRVTDDEPAMDIDDPSSSRPTTSSSQSLQSPLSNKTNRHFLKEKSSESPLSDKTNRQHPLNEESNDLNNNGGVENTRYNKLVKGDAGYGGRSPTPVPGQGLLARRFRGLGMQGELEMGSREFE